MGGIILLNSTIVELSKHKRYIMKTVRNKGIVIRRM